MEYISKNESVMLDVPPSKEEILRCYAKWLESFIALLCKRYLSDEMTEKVNKIVESRCSFETKEAMEK